MSKTSKKNSGQGQAPASNPPGATADLLERARSVDTAIKEAATGGNPTAADAMTGAPVGEPDAPKKKGRPAGSKTKQPEPEQPKVLDPFLATMLQQVTLGGLELAKKRGWTSPAVVINEKVIMTEEQWFEQVLACQQALVLKYCPDVLEAYAAELTLLMLVVPWAADNIWRMIEARKRRGTNTDTGEGNSDNRDNRDGKNNPIAKPNGQGSSAPAAS